ncbi:MAG: N-acetylmuramoyl-L-alanine amidase [Chloroflexota bacterium]
MQPRPLYLLLAMIALLILSVGVGSVLVSTGQHSAGLGAIATPTALVAQRVEASPTLPATNTAVIVAGVPTAARPVSTAIAVATAVVVATPTVEMVIAQAVIVPTPTPFEQPPPADVRVGGPVGVPNAHTGRRWVTLQAGHWKIGSLPPELQHLVGHTGASSAGVSEVDLNVEVSKRTAQLLADRGFNVEILDATVPVSYTTDLFLAIHADGNARSSMRGFKAVAPWVAVPQSDKFVDIFYEEYWKATGMPSDPVTSVAMADYYAFNPVSYSHSIDPSVPAALIEMGFVTNPLDRELMTAQQDRVAWGIANAVDRYFRSGAAGNTPTPYPSFTPTQTPTGTPTPSSTLISTPTETPTALPTELVPLLVETSVPTSALTPTPLATATKTPVPTATPLIGIETADGRLLPPLAANGRSLPLPGSKAPPVFLNEAVDEAVRTADGRERQQVWQQFYMPELGRSVWLKGTLRYVRP